MKIINKKNIKKGEKNIYLILEGDQGGQVYVTVPIIDKDTGKYLGDVYPIKNSTGSWGIRNHSSSGAESGDKWTIDVPWELIGKKGRYEIKFR